jgi:hypothetical protein
VDEVVLVEAVVVREVHPVEVEEVVQKAVRRL